jgi:alpha-1,2-mannosyltransferase
VTGDPFAKPRRPWWSISAREARWHARMLAAVLWIAAAVIGFAGAGDRSVAGPLKWADFVHFYTLGHLAGTGRAAELYEYDSVHATQRRLVPAADEIYPTVYPPQVALLFVPFAGWSYRTAALVWVLITVAAYLTIVRLAWREVRGSLPDWTLVISAALAFPPFWFVVVYGQVTIVVVLSFFLGATALARGRSYVAGLAFGLLAIKPQFGIALAAIVICRMEWQLLAGALTSVLLQIFVVAASLGASVLPAFLRSIPDTVRHVDLLESKPFMSVSLRTLTRLLPGWIGTPLWLLLAVGVLWCTVRAWRPGSPVRMRMAIVMLASVLVNPHLIVYDAAILALPLLWIGAFVTGQPRARAYWLAVYALFAFSLAPTALLVGLQISVLVIAWIFVFTVFMVTAPNGPTTGYRPIAEGA